MMKNATQSFANFRENNTRRYSSEIVIPHNVLLLETMLSPSTVSCDTTSKPEVTLFGPVASTGLNATRVNDTSSGCTPSRSHSYSVDQLAILLYLLFPRIASSRSRSSSLLRRHQDRADRMGHLFYPVRFSGG